MTSAPRSASEPGKLHRGERDTILVHVSSTKSTAKFGAQEFYERKAERAQLDLHVPWLRAKYVFLAAGLVTVGWVW